MCRKEECKLVIGFLNDTQCDDIVSRIIFKVSLSLTPAAGQIKAACFTRREL